MLQAAADSHREWYIKIPTEQLSEIQPLRHGLPRGRTASRADRARCPVESGRGGDVVRSDAGGTSESS
jgi:hypothetical protein